MTCAKQHFFEIFNTIDLRLYINVVVLTMIVDFSPQKNFREIRR